ncbi:O-antigen ligase family protein [Alienimonas californiensis]|uniref:O-Antigen ligase n=1 Tax=Alienimonas californiensis TaxID=2527989 RepID=A0A517PEG0_9PLAN|nr:O-antigen ligase family protein [Alienimonas californiensis]QDT17759.1 O-Antigen ligase [Alienimonas californiensis]
MNDASSPPPASLGRFAPPLVAATLALCFAGATHLWGTSLRPDYAPDAQELARSLESGDLLRRLGFLTLAGCGVVGLAVGRAGEWRIPLLSRGAGFTGALLAGMFGWWAASTLWSDDPALTARRILVLGLYLLGVLGAARALTGRQLAVAGVGAVSLHLIAGVAAEIGLRTFTPWRDEYRFSGTIHPNIQALQLAAGLCGCVVLSGLFAKRTPGERTNAWWLLWGAVLLGFLVLTKSRTATAGAVLAISLTGLTAASPATKLLSLAGGVAGGAGLLIAILLAGSDPTGELRDAALMGRTDQQSSLSGRLPIWEAILPHIAERPWLGHGYGAFWNLQRVDAISDEVGWALSASHSGWIESAAEVGLIGAGLMAALLLCGAGRAAGAILDPRRAGDPLPVFAVSLTLLLIANAFTEALIHDVRLVPFLLWACLAKLTVLRDRPPWPGLHAAGRPAVAAGGRETAWNQGAGPEPADSQVRATHG